MSISNLTTSGQPTFAPASTLSIPTGPPPQGKSQVSDQFIVFTDSWLKLQTYIQQGLKLPINQGEFTTKYGEFASKSVITNCLDGMKSVNELSNLFGAPKTIKEEIAKNSSYLTMKTPPSEIYGHMIWLANQVENSASTFSYTFQVLDQILGTGTEAERAANLKTILTGPGGLCSTADEMKVKTQKLISNVIDFSGKFDIANDKIITYGGQSSDIIAQANQAIGQLDSSITSTQKSANEAYSKWIAFTISAAAAPIGILIITGGLCLIFPPAAAVIAVVGVAAASAAAVGLALAAGAANKNYNNLLGEIQKFNKQKQQKVLLTTDLKGLNLNIDMVAPSLRTFKTNLEEINGVWTTMSMNLAYIANNYTEAQLADLQFLQQKLRIMDAQSKWQKIADSARNFTQNSLVSYSTAVDFGQNAPVAA